MVEWGRVAVNKFDQGIVDYFHHEEMIYQRMGDALWLELTAQGFEWVIQERAVELEEILKSDDLSII